MSKPSVFISHSHRDRHEATVLYEALSENGANPYLDQEQLRPGDDLPERIRKGIKGCDTFLLVWSAGAASSEWVQREWDMAYELRKKIVPYVLDGTRLPRTLENLLFIELKDQEVGNAQLLTTVFGKEFTPNATTLFPGRWQATMNALGMVTATYDLELRANGQLEGEGGASQSGVAGELARQMGVEQILKMRVQVHGSWSYDKRTKTLTLVIGASGFGQQTEDTVKIQTTGRESGAITGHDLAGRTWTLQRSGAPTRARRGPRPRKTQKPAPAQPGTKDYLQMAEEALMGQAGLQGANPDVATLIKMATAVAVFLKDVAAHGVAGRTYTTRIGVDRHRATLSAAYEDGQGRSCREVRSEKLVNGRWVTGGTGITTFVWQDGKWVPLQG